MKENSLQWFFNQLEFDESVSMDNIEDIFEQAKQMHKQEVEHAHLHNRCSGDQSSKCFIEALENAQQYYKNTFIIKP